MSYGLGQPDLEGNPQPGRQSTSTFGTTYPAAKVVNPPPQDKEYLERQKQKAAESAVEEDMEDIST